VKVLTTIITFLSVLPALAMEGPPRNENTVVLDETGIQNLAIETIEVEESGFEQTLFVLGEIDHTCESHAVLASRIPGRIIEVLAHKGDFVSKDGILARLESRQPGNPPPVLELRAPGSGLVIESQTHLGAPVEPDMDLMTILDLTTVWAVAKVPQNQAALLSKGLAARVSVPAAGKEPYQAEFLQLGVDADAARGTIDAIFSLPNPGNTLRPGMRAEISLITSIRDEVLAIPRAALQGDHSNRFVFIKDYELENAFVRIPVVVGEVSLDQVEILSGLMPGDEVVTRGSYALSFAGKGNASLKEALDAAHGHPHNEDGTEMTAEQLAATENQDGHGHRHDHGSDRTLVIVLSITCGVLFLLLIATPFALRSRSKA
jgi:membrane fusion protein, heavy metal efflux system